VVGFQQYARFISIEPDEDRRQFHTFSWQSSLSGSGLLVRTCGRIGTHGHSPAAGFPDRQSAQGRAERLIRRRLERRYELHAWR